MKIETTGCVLLCITGPLNGIEVTFLVDNGASECFINAIFTEQHDLK